MPRVTITVPDQNSQPYRFQLDREVVRLGRGSENDIVIDSGSVSTNHAEMRRITGGYELQDIGSTNGLKKDGLRYENVPLEHGQTVFLGDVSFDFSLTDEELEVLAREGPGGNPAPILPISEIPISTQPLGHAASSPKKAPKREVVREPGDGNGSVLGSLILIILAIAAFSAGASLRFQKDTGGSWFKAVKAKFSETKKPVKHVTEKPAEEAISPEPAAPEAAAPAPAAPAEPATPPAAPAPAQ